MTTDHESRSVYLGLGTNIGDREANLQEAIERIKGLGLEIIRASSIYETEPVGYHDQPWFLNQVIEANVLDWQILSLLKALQNIEREMGRTRTIPNGPRVIDIDILLYDDYVGFFTNTWSAEDNPQIAYASGVILELPHPRLHLRRFVLAPLCEIAPDLVHPQLKKSCSELLAELDDPSIVRVYQSRV
ncbi:MAG TPA: 2-amino-4-hydroxy-6-hydroxymethyldihydropteridine diphosphokinase [Blastocatellia bacterium]|nr:2-amino-4-hydroxy-6-hydroxymethyldihydropteridine diphosphokinase [Blastocatellia bacterium]